MAQIIKHRRGTLEALSAVTSSLQKGEIVIASGSSNITSSNGSSILFAAVENGQIQAVNRIMQTTGSVAPYFSGSIYNGMLNGVPFYASGSSTLFLLGTDGNSAINLVGNIQPFSSSVSASIASLSSSVGSTINSSLTALNTYTASAENKFSAIAASTASLNTYTSSAEIKFTGIGIVTSSLNQFTASINGWSGSLATTGSNIFRGNQTITGSLTISGSTTLTGSLTVVNGITGSLFGTASFALNGSSNAIMYQTGSASATWLFNHFLGTSYPVIQVYDNTNSVIIPQSIVSNDSSSVTITFSSPRTGVAVATKGGYVGSAVATATVANALTTARLINGTSFDGTQNITIPNLVSGSSQVSIAGTSDYTSLFTGIASATASLNAFSASNGTTSLNSYTASLLTALSASGANLTANGNLTVQGNLTIQGSQSVINSTVVNIGDNIINLNGTGVANGGIYVKDPTAPTTGTGSFIWDSTNDYWIAGLSGSESRILVVGGMGVVSGSSQINITQTTGYSTFSSSVASSNIFTQTGSAYATINNIQITGSLAVAGNITASNINVGAPSANAWGSNLQGSYFNNFTSASNVSEILRFVAGLLSASAPDASPNTRTLGSVTANLANSTTGTALTGRIPQSSTNTTITYLASKGFATAGSTIFTGIGTIYNTNTLGYNYTSVAAGTTVATSSADAQLFGVGVLSNGNPTTFNVSSSFTFRYMDNSSKTLTASSASVVNLQQAGAGTTNGVTLAKINTVNPAVIPPGYQDGKFAAAFSPSIYNGIATLNGASGSGYYHISASITIASGSSTYSAPTVQNGSELFYAPLTTIATNVPAQTVYTASVSTLTYVTAVSRSLSGAPYLSGSTYVVSSSISGAFAPLFLNGTNAQHTLTGTGMTATSGVTSVATSNGTISTANAVYDSTNTTVRATSTIPFETDLIRLDGLYTFGTANITNITQTTFTPTTFTVQPIGYNYNGTANTYTNTLSYHVAGTFGQPAASGSLAYYTRTQGADTATNSGSSNSEPFTGESFRMVLNDSLLTFAGTPWTTTFALNQLGGNDLQVKPGFLVKPGGANGYWLGDPDTSKTYKYYVRRFTTNGATKTSMTLNLGQSLVNWGSTTTPAIGALVLFQSSKNPTYTNARLYDPSDLTNNFVATKTANTNGQNPFGSNFDLYGNTGGSLATTTYTIPLRNADGMTLDATNTNIYVIVRYNGDPTPVTSMTVTFA
jgi:hypothetical protein